MLNPDAPAPSYTGLVGVGGYSRLPGLAPTTNTQHFVFGKRAFFGYLVRESGEIYWFANPHRPVEPARAERAAVTTEEWQRQLTEEFAGDQPLIHQIIGPAPEPLARIQFTTSRPARSGATARCC